MNNEATVSGIDMSVSGDMSVECELINVNGVYMPGRVKYGETVCKHGTSTSRICLWCQPLVERYECRDCGNTWWYETHNAYVCSSCRKTVGKSSSQEMVGK